MAANGLKMEPNFTKTEPGLDDLNMADIDEAGGYEDDTGELNMPNGLSEGWLLRVPKDLWDVMAHVKDDEEITVGYVKVWHNDPNDPSTKEPQTVRLELNKDLPKMDLSLVPKEYDLTSQVSSTKNTFVFSEKNLPDVQPRSAYKQDWMRGLDAREGEVRVRKPRGPRTIPKHTAYLAAASRELVCTPRDNDEYRKIEQLKRQRNVVNLTSFIGDETAARNLQQIGMQNAADEDSFIYTGSAARKRAQDNKATRMPEHELIDALEKCFNEYKFWPMSALKKRLRQPEAWLREVLSKIAVLIRTGQAANHYTLRPSGQYVDDDSLEVADMAAKIEEIAPESVLDDDDDEDMDFEDVPA